MSEDIFRLTRVVIACASVVLILFLLCCLIALKPDSVSWASEKICSVFESKNSKIIWNAPNILELDSSPESELIKYGRELIVHTSTYLGTRGKVAAISNGMNCQNCHLEAGTKFFANNFSAVASTYPKFRARSGTIETIEKRVNDCLERSLNGYVLDESSKEMRAIVSYLKWIGKGVAKDYTPFGAGVISISSLDRQADSIRGKIVFRLHCIRCHGIDGAGEKEKNRDEWKYPPLFGDNSYNTGAGLYRITRLAGFVRSNMPNDISTFEKPLLTDADAWDVSAYILSMPRPSKKFPKDWPDLSLKPIDHPFGPYADSFPESQHKFGPFNAMQQSMKRMK